MQGQQAPGNIQDDMHFLCWLAADTDVISLPLFHT